MNSFENPNEVYFSPPYVDYHTHLLTITFSKSYSLGDTVGVYAIDLNMADSFMIISSQYPNLDHFFILDTDYNVVYHSLYPNMLKKVSITQIEYGTTRKQMNASDDNVPDSDVFTDQSKQFNETVLPAFGVN